MSQVTVTAILGPGSLSQKWAPAQRTKQLLRSG